MNYQGDITLGDTIDIKFTTVNTSGVPTTLAGTPAVAAYVDNGTTEITAGVTLTVDFDARTGLHNVRVVASGGNGFAAATNVNLVITAGTVGGNSVVGYVVGSFSIGNRPVNVTKIGGTTQTARDVGASVLLSPGTGTGQINLSSGAVPVTGDLTATMKTSVQTELTTYGALKPTVAARTLDVTTTGEAGVDWANIGAPTTTVALSGTTVGTVTNLTNDPAGVTTLLSRIPAALFSGITSMAQWLGSMAGKQTPNATAQTEMRATGAGSGAYDATTDSNEAVRDRGDAAWLSGVAPTVVQIRQEMDTNSTQLAKLGTPTNLGTGGATIAGNLADIESQTDDIGVAGAGLTALPAGTLTSAYDAAKTAASQSSVNTIDDFVDTEVAAIKTVTDKLDTALELDGAVYRYTTNALEQAPAGGGGGADPWLTALPGAYASGTAGNIVGNRLDAAVSTRATPAQVNTECDTALVDVGLTTTVTGRIDAAISTRSTQTSVDGVAAKTVNLPGDPADASDIAASFATVNTKLDAISTGLPLDTAELNAIADALLKRDWNSVTGEAAYSALNAFRMLRNVWSSASGSLVVKKEDGTTTAWTRTLATDAAAEPIVGAS